MFAGTPTCGGGDGRCLVASDATLATTPSEAGSGALTELTGEDDLDGSVDRVASLLTLALMGCPSISRALLANTAAMASASVLNKIYHVLPMSGRADFGWTFSVVNAAKTFATSQSSRISLTITVVLPLGEKNL